MPDSWGKRQRRDVKAKKAAAREERRVARNRRRADRAAGVPTERARKGSLPGAAEEEPTGNAQDGGAAAPAAE